MDSENDKKRMNVESDRLSSLPDDLIHKILSFVDTIDAIKTSCLSSRWRFIWTTMPCLNFPNDDFFTLLKLSKYFSGRDNQREVSSVNLSFRGKSTKVFVKRILKYAISHNVRQLNLRCLIESAIEFPLSLISSQSLKHLSLKMDNSNRTFNQRGSIALTSMWEVPALTTLHLDGIKLSRYNTDNFSGLISKCVNLKNLSLRYCLMRGSNFNICHSQLSNLTIVYVPPNVGIFSVVAPQLKNLSIRHLHREFLISAPDLAYLLLDGRDHVNFSGDDFNSLEKVDICITYPSKKEPHKLVGLLQRLHSVKSLTLNLEILELLSSCVELMSHQHSPFANLKTLKIYPKRIQFWLKEKVDISAEVKNYLLDSSPSATVKMVSREEIKAQTNAIAAKNCMAELRLLLEQEKADIETIKDRIEQENADIETIKGHIEQENAPESHNAKMHDQQNAHAENQVKIKGNISHINSYWDRWKEQIKQRKKKINDIISKLQEIKKLLTDLPALTRAEMQPSFTNLCAEAAIVMSKITYCMKAQFDENQSCLNVGFHELATTLQSFP
ncbi:F-box domain, Leucine-rich repeat domain, L domain-like protein [Artemisia annua]|uniref:F-box domain, Leucine-rich repeat domain, L domain-like protein n=1 Tax=Artemisia annua TaxID=35608 RepID=A0A2U1LYY0_ARTAN|nr:F-box domain, Leucine-rich repeat domain, L domain-like protein [Artemisia annua]